MIKLDKSSSRRQGLNGAAWAPKKDYDSDTLRGGPLQLPANTQVRPQNPTQA